MAATSLTEERCRHIVQYLRGSRCSGNTLYPDDFSSNQKRALRQQAGCFEEKNGILFHRSRDGPKRLVICESEKARLLQACHDGVDGGHFGRDKTLSKVSSN